MAYFDLHLKKMGSLERALSGCADAAATGNGNLKPHSRLRSINAI
jgi:hypothetical protein